MESYGRWFVTSHKTLGTKRPDQRAEPAPQTDYVASVTVFRVQQPLSYRKCLFTRRRHGVKGTSRPCCFSEEIKRDSKVMRPSWHTFVVLMNSAGWRHRVATDRCGSATTRVYILALVQPDAVNNPRSMPDCGMRAGHDSCYNIAS